MKKRNTLTWVTSLIVALSIPLVSEEIDVSQNLRILELLPRDEVVTPICISPAVPQNFISKDPDGKHDIYDWIYWGPEETIQAFFKDRKSLKEPILRVTLSSSFQQEYGKLDLAMIKSQFGNIQDQFQFKTGHWGDLPYVLADGIVKGVHKNVVFVGLNQEGHVYCFWLVPPEDPKLYPTAAKFWEKFIAETKELPEPLKFKCMGQEMHIGHTICDAAGRKMLVRAEWNEKTRQVQIIAEPVDGNISFSFAKADLCRMGAKWHQNEPLLKIEGSIIVDNGWINMIQTTSVLLKNTEQFSKPSKKALFHQIFEYDAEGTLKKLKEKPSTVL